MYNIICYTRNQRLLVFRLLVVLVPRIEVLSVDCLGRVGNTDATAVVCRGREDLIENGFRVEF